MKIKTFIFLLLLVCQLEGFAQNQSVAINVSGKIVCNDKTDFSKAMIINKQTGVGFFSDLDGGFSLKLKKTDTLLVSLVGFGTRKISFRDSVQKEQYNIIVKLDRPVYTLNEYTVYPLKSLAEIQKNIKKIGVKKTNTYKQVNTLESPITALYERFSRLEQSKRLVAQLESDDLKRDALKDLFKLYIKYDIINLSTEQFDSFIDFCNLSDDYIKNSTQYELVETIKQMYTRFQSQNDYYRDK